MYFPQPEKFMPERFEKDSGLADENAFFPFGGGPRQCIAFRLGWILAKAIVVKVLSKYDFELKTKAKLTYDPKALTVQPKEPIKVQIHLKNH